MFKNLKYATIPPVCIWGTLLKTKAGIAASTVESNISYGSHLAAVKVDKVQTEMKTKMEESKVKREEKKAEKEAKKKEKEAKKAETKATEEKKSAETTSESKPEETVVENNEDAESIKTVNVVINNTFVDGEVIEAPNLEMPGPIKEEDNVPLDFSNLQPGIVIETVEPEDIRVAPPVSEERVTTPVDDDELKPVTQDDLDDLLKKMGGNTKNKK